MRRKSERNKAKGTPEKKVEKPTRRTTRRRGKASPSPSPDRENADDNVSTTPHSEDDKGSRLQGEEESNDAGEAGISSSGLIKSVLGGDEEDNGSVWKVARADASPGEIQKLKLCRQRNVSEASDSSLSKKKSNKWPDSGEGGIEEADSADEQIASSQKMFISEQADDPSSLHPGQDSKEEVSDYTENLPETTSANLSDDKTNIDKQADFMETVPETMSTSLTKQLNYEENQCSNSLDNLPGGNLDVGQSPSSRDNVPESTLESFSSNQENEECQGNPNELPTTAKSRESSNINTNEENANNATSVNERLEINKSVPGDENVAASKEELIIKDVESTENVVSEKESSQCQEINTKLICNIVNTELVSIPKKLSNKEEEEEEEGEIREELEREASAESDIASNTRNESDVQETRDVESPTTDTHTLRQKHDKYCESSASDSPESDEEQNKESQRKKTDSSKISNKNAKEENNRNKTEEQLKIQKNSILCEAELSESNMEREDILEINEKTDDLNVSLSVTKPAKVSLKRSFSTRLSTDSEHKKEENSNKKSNESNQNKENHANNEQPDQKSSTKRRRWGTTTSTDAAPAFSISTDSLKALVPGAKPLSVNELRLSKDEDEEKDHRKMKNENNEDHKQKVDVSKSDNSKKGDDKVDNHISSRRKIVMPKEPPRMKSPSPPEAQATNILLIRNLVRPFTLNQIKELLSRTGTIIENGFWMDRIKSKCFVEYANEDQAFETRQALHGVTWPLSNPKKLIVEYASKEDMEAARETSKDQPTTRKTEPLVSADLWQQDQWSREERPTVVNKITVIREWDLGKEDGQLHGKEKDKDRKEFDKKKRQRSRSPVVEAHLPPPARKFKKKEEEPTTSKLLDDLFRKTKATPCIYWLPLTNEQISIKEEMRRQHMAEHARRLEEIRRVDRSRDSRRRRSPRK